MTTAYGLKSQAVLENESDRHIENIERVGFTIVENVLNDQQIKHASNGLYSIYDQQLKEFSFNKLDSINETNLVRCPLLYNDYLLTIAAQEKILSIARLILGDFIILHLQNGIIVKPGILHHQHLWHRDLPYQEFVISKPLALSALFCLNDFYPENGGTAVLPASHKFSTMPSDDFINKWKFNITAKAGSVILFDAMLYHQAGNNTTQEHRLGINHVYSVPIIKQQINLPEALNGKYQTDESLSQLLGYTCNSPKSVQDFRETRFMKKKKPLY